MKKVLLYSITPQHMLNILNGNKTIEVRKRDLPQWAKEALERGEVVEGYGYCTKGDVDLYHNIIEKDYVLCDGKNNITYYDGDFQKAMMSKLLNGKVVVKFEVSESEMLDVSYSMWTNAPLKNEDIIKKSCLTSEQIEKYSWDGGAYKDLYAHHLTNIQPIEPMEIDRFISDSKSYNECPFAMSLAEEYMTSEEILINRGGKILTKAPQSFMTAWVKEVTP